MDKSFTFARNNGNQSRCYRRNRKQSLVESRSTSLFQNLLSRKRRRIPRDKSTFPLPRVALHAFVSHYINPVTHYPRITNDRMTALNQWNGEKYLDNFRSCNNTNQRNQSSDRLDPLDVVRIFPALDSGFV